MTPKPTGKVKLTEAQVEVLRLLVKYPDVFLRESISFWFESWDGTRNRFQYEEAVKPSTVAVLKRHKLIARGKGKMEWRKYHITPRGRRAEKESSK